jgi:arylsulfatase A
MQQFDNRRTFLKSVVTGTAAALSPLTPGQAANAERPNVVLILTDDQGYGDIGCHGNPIVQTPRLDQLAAESTEFTRFYVNPVCTPTRASLMTGRYPCRTGATEVNQGRSLLRADEVTLPEMLKSSGYATGIFGKWHLGDNYPIRPSDKGFDECLVHKGGGIGQSAGPIGNSYFDPVLEHNNQSKRYDGYCNDIFFDEAARWIGQQGDKPFFTYIATNLPHMPLDVGKEYVIPYRGDGMNELNAKAYGMITNIDDNVGRLLNTLDRLSIADNTIVIFLSDNGPRTSRIKNDVYPDRYNAALRGTKTAVYEGGIRVPFFIRWPERLQAGKRTDTIAAHIDVVPTLLDACGVAQPEHTIDGISLLPVTDRDTVPGRTLFFQLNQTTEPLLYAHFAAISQRYKLVQPMPNPRNTTPDETEYTGADLLENLELYDIPNDVSEIENIARQNPAIVDQMLTDYDAWFYDVTRVRDYHLPQPIIIGTAHENPSILSDFDRVRAKGLDYWRVQVAKAGRYRATVTFRDSAAGAVAHLRIGEVHVSKPLSAGAKECIFDGVTLPEQTGHLQAWVMLGRKPAPAYFVTMTKK